MTEEKINMLKTPERPELNAFSEIVFKELRGVSEY